MKRRGFFITLDGIDGSGKSTHVRLLADYLRRRGHRVVTTREPGGTRAGEAIRRAILGRKGLPLAPLTELALMYAARAQHIEEVLRPGLARGRLILSDRYNDASLAYQGYGRGLGVATVRALDRIICGDLQPDLTIILDLDPKESLRRVQGRRRRRGRFEAEGIEFLRRAREGYQAIARREPRRVILVPADRTLDDVQAEIRKHVDRFIAHPSRREAQRRKADRPVGVSLPMGAF